MKLPEIIDAFESFAAKSEIWFEQNPDDFQENKKIFDSIITDGLRELAINITRNMETKNNDSVCNSTTETK